MMGEQMKLSLGQRVYYTGDMANEEGAGTVVSVNPPTFHTLSNGQTVQMSGVNYDVESDDGRKWRGLTDMHFEPGPGRRFWLLDEWLESRRKAYQTSMAAMRKCLKSGAE